MNAVLKSKKTSFVNILKRSLHVYFFFKINYFEFNSPKGAQMMGEKNMNHTYIHIFI